MSLCRPDLTQLRSYIGREVLYRGVRCQVLEVLADLPALVLLDSERNTHIQDNQYGNPQRQVPCTYTVPLMDSAETLHPDFIRLGLLGTD